MSEVTHPLGDTEHSPEPASRSSRSILLKREMPGLDALRGIAVLSVVFLHGLKMTPQLAINVTHGIKVITAAVSAGWLGVTLFFVLSGFLITGILLDTKTRSNYWRSFYVRRMLRILPVYLVTLLLCRLLLHVSWTYIGLCLLFVANFIELRMASYGPLWSLAVEEQFYLVWPFLVRRLTQRTLAILCLASILLSPWLRLLAARYALGNPYDATWLITDNLFLGAFLALFLRSRFSTPRNVTALTATLGVLAVVIGALCLQTHSLSRNTVAGRAFQTEPFLFLFGMLLLLSLRFGGHPLVVWLTAPLRFYGYISYGLYLSHWLVFNLIAYRIIGRWPPLSLLTAPVLLGRFAVSLVVATLIAWLSRRYFEEPFLRLKDRLVPYKPAAEPSTRPRHHV
jgi:peptidoglycan/LPS O-acetylase OafA/YrhL